MNSAWLRNPRLFVTQNVCDYFKRTKYVAGVIRLMEIRKQVVIIYRNSMFTT